MVIRLPVTLVATFVLLAACGTNKAYHITSDPPGAVVKSGDVVYGTTPFDTDLNTLLPNRQWDFRPSASRKLMFVKDGYLSGSAVVSEFGEPGSVHVVLQREVSQKEKQLQELKTLYEKGLIEKDEYDDKRQDVLNAQ